MRLLSDPGSATLLTKIKKRFCRCPGDTGVTKGLQPPSIDTKIVGSLRMGARVVDWARLESVCTARYRGFESLPIRQISPYSLAARKLNIQLMPN
jgi:hypothetical protein